MTRYKVTFEIAVQDTTVNGLRNFEETLAGMLGDNIPATSGWATTVWPKFGAFEKVERFADTLRKPVDPRWKAILEKVDEIASDGVHHMSSRGTAMEGSRGELSCVAKYYRRVGRECSDERYVYIITCEPIRNDVAYYVKVAGPYVDSGDSYWQEMAERDKREGDALITDKWDHYTVHKDSKNPGSCDGFGGSEFRFILLDRDQAKNLLERGFNVKRDDRYQNEYRYLLTSRNVWSQSRIPKAMRHLFTPNVQDVGSVKDIKPLDLEAGLFPVHGSRQAEAESDMDRLDKES